MQATSREISADLAGTIEVCDLLSGIALPRSALENGLSSRDDIASKLREIGGLQITDSIELLGCTLSAPRSEAQIAYSESQHREYLSDVAADFEQLQAHLLRAKIPLLKELLRGSYHQEKPEGAAKDWDKDFPIVRLLIKAYRMSTESRPLESGEARELIDACNRFLPDEAALPHSDLIDRSDVKLVHQLLYSMSEETPASDDDLMRDATAKLVLDCNGIQRRLREMKCVPTLFAPSEVGADYETALSEERLRYRAILKGLVAAQGAGSWLSPAFGKGLGTERGRDQESRPFESDYQRYNMPEFRLEGYKLTECFFRRRVDFDEGISSTVFPSGMAAFQAVFHRIKADLKHTPKNGAPAGVPRIYKTPDMYFEADGAILNLCEELGCAAMYLDTTSGAEIVRSIQENLPHAVFLAPLSNAYGMSVVEVRKVMQGLMEWEWKSDDRLAPEFVLDTEHRKYYPQVGRKMSIIVDDTTLGALATWHDLDFKKLPKFIKVYSIQSLMKYGQDGLELAQAGLVTSIGDMMEDLHVSRVRSSRFLMPPEATMRSVALNTNRAAFERKLERHSRNTHFLVNNLQPEGFIAHVSHPFLSGHSSRGHAADEMRGAGGLFNLRLSWQLLDGYQERGEHAEVLQKDYLRWGKDFRHRMIAQSFVETCVKLAESIGLPLNAGTSFGFNTTRVAAYDTRNFEAPAKDREMDHYLRVAPGTESLKGAALVCAVIKRASELFLNAIEEGRLWLLVSKLKNLDAYQKICYIEAGGKPYD